MPAHVQREDLNLADLRLVLTLNFLELGPVRGRGGLTGLFAGGGEILR